MISRPRATSSRTSPTGSSSRSATRCIWGVTAPWRARYCWVTQSIPTPFAGASRIRFKGCDLSSPDHAASTPVAAESNYVRRALWLVVDGYCREAGAGHQAGASGQLARLGRAVALRGVVDLFPFRAECERIGASRAVEREDAVEMIDLVLQQLGHRPLELHGVLLALQIGGCEGRRVGARHAHKHVREAEAVVPHEEVIRPDVGDLRVDHGPTLLVHLDEHDPHRRPDLRRCHGPAHLVLFLRHAQRVPQVVRDEASRGRLGVLDPLAADPQDGIAQLANASYGHAPPIWGFGAAVQLGVS